MLAKIQHTKKKKKGKNRLKNSKKRNTQKEEIVMVFVIGLIICLVVTGLLVVGVVMGIGQQKTPEEKIAEDAEQAAFLAQLEAKNEKKA